MKLHILGICGTFMGSLALLARSAGHRVSGCDAGVYPPMSELLAAQGIAVSEGYEPAALPRDADLVLVGNALSRGNAAVEALLDSGRAYASGPEWLGREILAGRHVLAVAGTHGKTTGTSMLAWILEHAGLEPGFLVGGVPGNFPVSARLGSGGPFVIEADEYDTAFFDKRSKFVHYRPRTVLLNNLEYDHADIFPDLAAIQRQFHHLLRTVPARGTVVVNGTDEALAEVLELGCWSRVETFGPQGSGACWEGRPLAPAGEVEIVGPGERVRFPWTLAGSHNVDNAVAACAAASTLGVSLTTCAEALAEFRLPRRRQELVAEVGGVRVIDDFAHHPTAIARTLEALAQAHPERRLLVALEPRSNTMRQGVHGAALGEALTGASAAWMLAPPGLGWDPAEVLGPHVGVAPDIATLLSLVLAESRPGDQVVFMSNGAFGGAPRRFAAALRERNG